MVAGSLPFCCESEVADYGAPTRDGEGRPSRQFGQLFETTTRGDDQEPRGLILLEETRLCYKETRTFPRRFPVMPFPGEDARL